MAEARWFVERFLLSIPSCTTHTDSWAGEIIDQQIGRSGVWSI
jgi:hypothetical protein